MEYEKKKKRYKGWPGLDFLGNPSSVCSQERQMLIQRTAISETRAPANENRNCTIRMEVGCEQCGPTIARQVILLTVIIW